jgi:hypothetical protein
MTGSHLPRRWLASLTAAEVEDLAWVLARYRDDLGFEAGQGRAWLAKWGMTQAKSRCSRPVQGQPLFPNAGNICAAHGTWRFIRVIETLKGFDEPWEIWVWTTSGDCGAFAAGSSRRIDRNEKQLSNVPDKPSVAVLPFQNNGHLFKTMGDGALIEFPKPVFAFDIEVPECDSSPN